MNGFPLKSKEVSGKKTKQPFETLLKGQILASTTVLNLDHLKALCMVTRRRGPVEIEMRDVTHSVCSSICKDYINNSLSHLFLVAIIRITVKLVKYISNRKKAHWHFFFLFLVGPDGGGGCCNDMKIGCFK